MYAALPRGRAIGQRAQQLIQGRKRRRGFAIARGGPPQSVLDRITAARTLQAYQFGAFDTAEGANHFMRQQAFYGALDTELARSGLLYDDAEYAGGLGLKIKRKLPKFIRKMKPLRVLGKAAKIAAPVVGVATGGVLLPAVVGAGGAVLRKGKRVKFKSIVGGAAAGAAGGLARRAAPGLLRGAKGLVRGVSRTAGRTPALPGVPSVTPPSQADLDAAAAASQEQMSPLEQMVSRALAPPTYTPTYQPTETAAAYTPPGEEVPGETAPSETPPGEPPKPDLKKLLVPGLIAAALLL